MKPTDLFLESLNRMNVNKSNKLLLAVSGGLDSMVMMHLFHECGFMAVIAHCNFKLRGEESDLDAALVEKNAVGLGFTFHQQSFETAAFAKDNGISIQMAARRLRYDWFHQLAQSENCTYIATAHHADDQAETILLNLTKGTGIAGMHGIPELSGRIIRPLIHLKRDELVAYADEKGIHWRDDASNHESAYERNFIRNEVVPLLRSINPSVTDAINKHSAIMTRYENLINHFISEAAIDISHLKHNGVFNTFNTAKLLQYPEPATILFHLVRHTALSFQQCEKAILSDTVVGAEFHSGRWTMVKDRTELVLYLNESVDSEEEAVLTQPGDSVDLRFGSIESMHIEKIEESEFPNPCYAFMDADKISWPLQIRRIKTGDRFHPLGMTQSKLISDFFIDNKIGTPEKSTAYLVLSNGLPIWICPHRLDDRFKITPKTRKIVRLSFYKP